MAQGSRAHIWEVLDQQDTVVRQAPWDEAFERDVRLRRFLQQQGVAVTPVLAVHRVGASGWCVMPRAAHGHVLSYLLDHPDQTEWVRDQLTALITRLHELGVVHRDVGWQNVLVPRPGQLWLSDFEDARTKEELEAAVDNDHLHDRLWSAYVVNDLRNVDFLLEDVEACREWVADPTAENWAALGELEQDWLSTTFNKS